MYTSRPLYLGRNDTQFVVKLQQGTLNWGERPDNMAPMMWEALQECWAPDPSSRPTAGELLRRFEAAGL